MGAPGECGRSHNTSMDHELSTEQTLGRLVAGRTHEQGTHFLPFVESATPSLNGGAVGGDAEACSSAAEREIETR